MGARGLRQRLCACTMAHGTHAYERLMAPRKRELFAALDALGPAPRVVEIGAGTGANIPYLPRSIRYSAVEPNPFMHSRLRRRAADSGLDIDLLPCPLESLDLPDGSADAAVCTLVLCSVPDPAAAVARIKRLLRPGGRYLFIEHVAAPTGTWLRRVQRTVRPVWRLLGDGCEPDRETWRTIDTAGFSRVESQKFSVPVPVVGPHVLGWAER